MLAALFSRTAALLAAAVWATTLLPVGHVQWRRFMANRLFGLWRTYFSFSIVYETQLDSSRHYLYADFPHGELSSVLWRAAAAAVWLHAGLHSRRPQRMLSRCRRPVLLLACLCVDCVRRRVPAVAAAGADGAPHGRLGWRPLLWPGSRQRLPHPALAARVQVGVASSSSRLRRLQAAAGGAARRTTCCDCVRAVSTAPVSCACCCMLRAMQLAGDSAGVRCQPEAPPQVGQRRHHARRHRRNVPGRCGCAREQGRAAQGRAGRCSSRGRDGSTSTARTPAARPLSAPARALSATTARCCWLACCRRPCRPHLHPQPQGLCGRRGGGGRGHCASVSGRRLMLMLPPVLAVVCCASQPHRHAPLTRARRMLLPRRPLLPRCPCRLCAPF